MKRVLLGVVTPNGAEPVKVASFLINIIKTPAAGKGFDLSEVRTRLKIIDKLEPAVDAEHIDLEDAEHTIIKRAIGEAVFTTVDRALVDIADRVVDAKAPPPQ